MSLPTTIDFTDSDLKAQGRSQTSEKKRSYPKLRKDCWMKFRVARADVQETSSGSLAFVESVNPVTEDGEAVKGVGLRKYLVLPTATEKNPKTPKTLGIIHSYLVATRDFSRYPRKDKENGGWITPDGEHIDDFDTVEAIKNGINERVTSTIKEFYNAALQNPDNTVEQLVGDEFWGLVKETNGFLGIQATRKDAPEESEFEVLRGYEKSDFVEA